MERGLFFGRQVGLITGLGDLKCILLLFYRSNVALEEFDVAGWRAQPFILRDFPVAPYIETAKEEYDLINVADATSALQGDLYLHQMNTLYQMYEILNPHPITGKFTIYNIRTEVSYVSTCERRRIIQSY
ncbi:MAG: hypothetical protein EBW44_04275 [Rhodobacteraceae bacterium]|nr:hypothetical protein [Paracoccaceae bacterium]